MAGSISRLWSIPRITVYMNQFSVLLYKRIMYQSNIKRCQKTTSYDTNYIDPLPESGHHSLSLAPQKYGPPSDSRSSLPKAAPLPPTPVRPHRRASSGLEATARRRATGHRTHWCAEHQQEKSSTREASWHAIPVSLKMRRRRGGGR